jgi:hypothetical protein
MDGGESGRWRKHECRVDRRRRKQEGGERIVPQKLLFHSRGGEEPINCRESIDIYMRVGVKESITAGALTTHPYWDSVHLLSHI